MSTLTLTLVPYDLPLPRPLVTAHGIYERRTGIIIVLDDKTGVRGLGDAAPLPGFSRETIADVRTVAQELAEQFAASSSSPITIPESPDQLRNAAVELDGLCDSLPSLRYALESAISDLASRRLSLPLAQWLSPDAAAYVEVNALVDGSRTGDIAERARAAHAAGFSSFKIKVGVGSLSDDVERVAALRRAVPEAQIRVDANGAWTEAEAREALSGMQKLNLEFIEQPLPVGNILPARRLACDSGIPLALDEEIETSADASALIEEQMGDILILKPMILGSIGACLNIVEAAKRHDMGVVFTSSWESDIGLAATLHLSAATGSTARAAGLATAGMIADGLVDHPLKIRSGRLLIPETPGLGLNLLPGAYD